MVVGFDPFIREDSRLLILGSFPSVKSRANDFYYGNPLNRFWRVLANAFSDEVPQTNEQKKAFLAAHNVALWDVVTQCEIEGSLDSNIKNYTVGDVGALIRNSRIERVLLNGSTAARLFLNNFPQYASISVALPSTSPANTRFDAAAWHRALQGDKL